MSPAAEATISECRRQEENANYTAVQLLMWLRDLRRWKRLYLITQLAAGAGAAIAAVGGAPLLAGGLGAWAGVAPSVWDAMKLDAHEESIRHHAAEFTRLRDAFRQARSIELAKGDAELDAAFRKGMREMNEARRASLTPPERYFKAAQRKIQRGDYEHTIDMPKAK